MEYLIQRGAETIATIRPTGNLSRRVMAEHLVRMEVELPAPVDFHLGDYVVVYRERFELNKLPEIDKNDSKGYLEYRYTFTFEALFYRLNKIIVKGLDGTNQLKKINHVLTGTADAHIDLIIRNANLSQSGWIKGVVERTNATTITYNGQNCLAILSTLAQEFGLEWWVDGQTIHLSKRAKPSGLKFEYGQGKGLYRLIRTNLDSSNVVTRLYVEGGTKNLRGDYRNYSDRLQLPEATGGYLEKNVDLYGIIEHALTFDEIFPNRAGTVTSVTDIYTFSDTTLDFNVNDYLLPGVTATIGFDTGPLAGYELELASFNNATKTFVVNANEQEKALEIPSTAIHARTGDRYKIFNIQMPQSYVTEAETELRDGRGWPYLNQNCVPRVMYAVEPDRIFFLENGVLLNLGDYANVVDEPLRVDINPRIVSYDQDLHEETYYPRIELSENVQIPAIVRQYAAQEQYRQALITNNFTVARVSTGSLTLKTIPTKHDIVLYPYFFPDLEGDKPLYWKENNVVKLSGDILQPTASDSGQRRGTERPAFNLPIGYRPKADVKCPVQVETGGGVRGTGSMRITVTGDAYITFLLPVGDTVRESLIKKIDLAGANFSLL